MKPPLMEVVLPRLAQRLHKQLKLYRSGALDDNQFTRNFEDMLQRQYAWLAKRGVSEAKAALAIHGAVLVLSGPGMRAEAEELNQPFEVVEQRAVQAAAADIAQCYKVNVHTTLERLSNIIARYAD